MRRSTFVLMPSILMLSGAASAGTLFVPTDFPTIQEAVSAAVSGDLIVVGPGCYRENVTITTGGITLKGKKATIDGAYAGTCLTVKAHDVTLLGLAFANGGTAAAGDTPGGGLDCIGTGASISMCQAHGCTDFGIRLTGTGTIDHCRISACLGPGLVVDTMNASGPSATLRSNKVLRCAAGIEAHEGPFLLERNMACTNTGVGIQLSIKTAGTGGEPSDSTQLKRNKCLGNGGAGLLVNDELGWLRLIAKNDLEDNGIGLDLTSVALDALTVSQNDITGNRAGGIAIRVSGALVHGNRIGSNALFGLAVLPAGDAPSSDNTLTGNKLAANGGDGIYVATDGNVLGHNLLQDNSGDGVQVAGGVAGTWLIDNSVRDSGNDGIDNWGIDTLIRDNTTRDNCGADLAGKGDGGGTVDDASGNNIVKDGTGLTSKQELELDTLP